jgi:hypothetical protein
MRNGLLLLASAWLVAGCGGGMPDFLGREGGDGFYRVGGEALPDPVPVAMRSVVAERSLTGVIVRVEGEAPAQGYWGAALEPVGDGTPDAGGAVSFRFVAIPPVAVEAVGPARTRRLSAAAYVPNLALKNVRAVRIAGIGTAQTLPLPAAPAPPPVVAPEF